MNAAQLERMQKRIERLSSPAKERLKERLRTLEEDELRLTADVKQTFIQQLGADAWNESCPQFCDK